MDASRIHNKVCANLVNIERGTWGEEKGKKGFLQLIKFRMHMLYFVMADLREYYNNYK